MQVDWAHLKTAVERGLHSAEKGEQGSVRVHCGAAERMLKGARDDVAKKVLDAVHHAKVSLEPTRAVEYLKKAVDLLAQSPAK